MLTTRRSMDGGRGTLFVLKSITGIGRTSPGILCVGTRLLFGLCNGCRGSAINCQSRGFVVSSFFRPSDSSPCASSFKRTLVG